MLGVDTTPGNGHAWGRQLLKAAARLVLRPARPADGLAAPDVRPAWLNAYQKFGDEWTSITLA
jgi:hypothetical protein